MKVENVDNNNISPLSPKKADNAYRAQANSGTGSSDSAVGGTDKRDKAVVSENARMLAKARAALENAPEVENERLTEIRKQINNGDYTIQVENIARRLMGGVFRKNS
jgi:flagellar biosynthesis anti-sigma factor FlgM